MCGNVFTQVTVRSKICDQCFDQFSELILWPTELCEKASFVK